MRFGFVASVLFHLCIVGGIVVWGRDWSPARDFMTEPSVPVELITQAKLAEITNIPAAVEEPEEDEPFEFDVPDDPEPILHEPIVVAALEPEETAPPPPPEKTEPEVTPEEPEPVKEPDPEPPKPKPEPPKPKPVVKKKEPDDGGFDLDKYEDSLKKIREEEANPREPRETPRTAENTRSGSTSGELTATETALVKAAMQKCWKPLDGAPNPEKLRVEVNFRLNRDGTLVASPKVLNSTQIALSGNRFWKVAEQNAIRAVVECQPYDFLPGDRYERWKEFNLNFVPEY